MSSVITRRAVPVVGFAAAVALVAGLLAITQASAKTIYACVPSSGSPHIFSKKPKCKAHESRISWTSKGEPGSEGLQGPQGLAGPTGAAGAAGKGVTGAVGATGHIGVTGPEGPTVVSRISGVAEETTGTELGAETGTSEAACIDTEKLVGGGAQTGVESSGADPVPAIVQSYPAGSKWIAQAAVLKAGDAGSTISVTAYALCAK